MGKHSRSRSRSRSNSSASPSSDASSSDSSSSPSRDRSSSRSKRHKKSHHRSRSRTRSRNRSRSRTHDSKKERDDERSSSRKQKKRKKEKDTKHSKSKKESKHSKKDSKKSKKDRKKKDKKRSRSRSRSRSSTAASSSAPFAPSISHSAASITRSLTLIDTLLTHGGGDRATSLRELQFLFFKLDSGHQVNLDDMNDPLIRHILASIFREMGLTSTEEGWRIPMQSKGKVAFHLLDVLAAAFKSEVGNAPESSAVQIGVTMPPAATASTSAADSSVQRILGPSLPSAADFDRMAGVETEATEAKTNDDDEDDAGFGPKLPDQMTEQELIAFNRLRASREQLAALQSSAGSSSARAGGREEWMLVLPSVSSGLPSTSALATLMASGDRNALKGRGFANKTRDRAEQSSDWTLSPAEREKMEIEKLAIRQAEQAVWNSSRDVQRSSAAASFSSDLSSSSDIPRSANSSAAAAQAANDRMMARYKQQQATTESSLLASHQRADAAKRKEEKESGGLFVWNHAEQMGMRAMTGEKALKKELNAAYSLNDNFAESS